MTDVLHSANPPSTGPWPLPRFLRASLGLHAAALTGAAAFPDGAAWAAGAIVLNHAGITAAGLLPRCDLLGDNLRRLPAASAARSEIALTIDDGPEPAVTPQVLDLLDSAGQRATFFCIADRVLQSPQLAREIVARGHSIQNHTARHRHNFSFLGPGGYRGEIERAQQILFDTTGQRATCFRAPAGLRNPFLAPVLHRLGLRLVSWTRRGYDTRESDPAVVGDRLTRNLRAGDILLIHDGNAAHSSDGQAVTLHVLPRLLQAFLAAGLHSVTLPGALAADGATLAGLPPHAKPECA